MFKSNISKILVCAILLLAFACSLIGCTKPNNSTSLDGVIGGRKPSGRTDAVDGEGAYYSPSVSGKSYESGMEYSDFVSDPVAYNGQYVINAGTLTAAEYRDKNNLKDWINLFNEREWDELAKSRKLNPGSIVKVTVKNGDKKIFNTKVELLDENDNVIFTAVTDINGEAFLFYNLDKTTDKPVAVKVGSEKKEIPEEKEVEFETSQAGVEVKEIDIMLMVDTTGSMGDELEYLKVELKDMVKRVSSYGQNLSIKVSVNFYRDDGDEYIVKYYDFRDNIDDVVDIIGQQSADGGGDYPEAVHTALENAVTGHVWREKAVKICFFVLDAPPHTESEIQGINANILKSLKKAAESGIRIVPVLSSGADTETEFLTRTFGIITGGSFVFLTNHSGIGNPHHEPDVDEYEVEYLNECLIRIICDFCGLHYEKPEVEPIVNPTEEPATEPVIQ